MAGVRRRPYGSYRVATRRDGKAGAELVRVCFWSRMRMPCQVSDHRGKGVTDPAGMGTSREKSIRIHLGSASLGHVAVVRLLRGATRCVLISVLALSEQQKDCLRNAIEQYGFPPDHFDFSRNAPESLANTRAIEIMIGRELKSGEPERVKNGLANVLYWGYAQMGIRHTRVRRFRTKVCISQLKQPASSFDAPMCPPSSKSRTWASRSFLGSRL